jgi:hypothetical protein
MGERAPTSHLVLELAELIENFFLKILVGITMILMTGEKWKT